jgi:hypothetical protein
MKVKIDKEDIFHLIIIFVASIGLCVGRTWPYETGLFPRTVAIIVIIVTSLSFLLEFYEKIKKSKPGKNIIVKSEFGKNALINFAWLAAYIISTWLFGYVVASSLYVFLYLKVKGKLSWIVSIMVTVGAFAFLEVVFVILLRIRMLPGVLWNWLG